MASPGFSPISEDGEVGETPNEGTPSLPPSAFAAVAAAAAALSAPAVPLADGADATRGTATGPGVAADEQGLEAGAFEPQGASWGPPGTVLLLPANVGAPGGMQQSEGSEFEAPHISRRSSDSYSMEVEPASPLSPSALMTLRSNHQDSSVASTVASPSSLHPAALADSAAASAASAGAAGSVAQESGAPWQHQTQQRRPQQQHALAGVAAGFSTERIAAVLATVDSRQASVETAANLIYRFAAAVPPPHVATAAAEAATHAAGAASKEAAAAAVASAGNPLSPVALRALTRTAGANAAAAAAAAAGALPLSICYIMLDSYRRSQPKHRLAIFYVFHRLMHLSSAARANTDSSVPPGSIEDAGYAVFVLPVVQELSNPEMDSVRHKMLRCIAIWREWRVYTPAALRHIRQLAAKGVSCHSAERGEVAAAEAWAALLQLQPLRFLAQTPSGRKAYAYARQCFNRMCRESFPVCPGVLIEPAESATSSATVDLSSPAELTTPASAPSSGVEESGVKRQKAEGGTRRETQPKNALQTRDTSKGGGELEEADFVSNDFSLSALRQLSDEQLAACSKLFDRASRVTGQEYLLLQSSLMDLSGLLQMQHQRLLELREEMQRFAAVGGAAEGSTTAAPSGQLQNEDAFMWSRLPEVEK
ncbi:hypothetical protein Efla_003107 [Eimeria flavescens]